MKISRSARLITAATAAVLLSVPVAASAQDCVEDATGSAAGQPVDCEEDTEVGGVDIVRDELPAPDPVDPQLAATGSSSQDLALGAAAALGAGGALVLVSRRRRDQA